MSATATEKCGCGAEITAVSRWNSELRLTLAKWRREHACTRPAAAYSSTNKSDAEPKAKRPSQEGLA